MLRQGDEPQGEEEGVLVHDRVPEVGQVPDLAQHDPRQQALVEEGRGVLGEDLAGLARVGLGEEPFVVLGLVGADLRCPDDLIHHPLRRHDDLRRPPRPAPPPPRRRRATATGCLGRGHGSLGGRRASSQRRAQVMVDCGIKVTVRAGQQIEGRVPAGRARKVQELLHGLLAYVFREELRRRTPRRRRHGRGNDATAAAFAVGGGSCRSRPGPRPGPGPSYSHCLVVLVNRERLHDAALRLERVRSQALGDHGSPHHGLQVLEPCDRTAVAVELDLLHLLLLPRWKEHQAKGLYARVRVGDIQQGHGLRADTEFRPGHRDALAFPLEPLCRSEQVGRPADARPPRADGPA